MNNADAASIAGTLVTAVVTLLVGLFGGGTIVALLRVQADRGKVVIEAAQGAVIVQTGVIEALQEELNRIRAERDADRIEILGLRAEVLRLQAQGADTATRVSKVEQATDSA